MSVKAVQIDADVEAVLRAGSFSGGVFVLPTGLDRGLYVRTDKVLQALGAKWNRSAGGHVGGTGFAGALSGALSTGQAVDLKKTLGYFPTPPEIARQAVEALGLSPGERVLEPSAGGGALARALIDADVILFDLTLVEIDPDRCRDLKDRWDDATVLCADFLSVQPTPRLLADRIVMNPPYDRTTWRDHVLHALDFLKPAPAGEPKGGARLVAILPASAATDEKLADALRSRGLDFDFDALPAGSFKAAGTGVNTVLLTAKRTAATAAAAAPATAKAVTVKPMPAELTYHGPSPAPALAATAYRARNLIHNGADDVVGAVDARARYIADPSIWRKIATGDLVGILLIIEEGARGRGFVDVADAAVAWIDRLTRSVVGKVKYDLGALRGHWAAMGGVLTAASATGTDDEAVAWFKNVVGAELLAAANAYARVVRRFDYSDVAALRVAEAHAALAGCPTGRRPALLTSLEAAEAVLDDAVRANPKLPKADATEILADAINAIFACTAPAPTPAPTPTPLPAPAPPAPTKAEPPPSAYEPRPESMSMLSAPEALRAMLAAAEGALPSTHPEHQDFVERVVRALHNAQAHPDPAAILGDLVRRLHERLAEPGRPTTLIEALLGIASRADVGDAPRFDLIIDGALVASYTDAAEAAVAAQQAKDEGRTVELRRVTGSEVAMLPASVKPGVLDEVAPETARRWTSAMQSYDLSTTTTIRGPLAIGDLLFRLVEIEAERLSEQEVAYGVAEGLAPGTVFVATEAEFAAWRAEAGLPPMEPPEPSPEAEAVVTATPEGSEVVEAARVVGVYGTDTTGTLLYIDSVAVDVIQAAGYEVAEDPEGASGHDARPVLWVVFDGAWLTLMPVDAFLDGGRGTVYRIVAPTTGSAGAEAAVVAALTGWYGAGLIRYSDLQVVEAEAGVVGSEVEGPKPPPVPAVSTVPEILDTLGAAKRAFQANLDAIRAAVRPALGVGEGGAFTNESLLYEADGIFGTWISPEGTVRVILIPDVSSSFGAGGETLFLRASVSLTALGFDYNHEGEITPEQAGTPKVLFGSILDDASVMLGTTQGDVAEAAAAEASAQAQAWAAEVDPETGLNLGAASAIEDFIDSTIEHAYTVERVAFPFVQPRSL